MKRYSNFRGTPKEGGFVLKREDITIGKDSGVKFILRESRRNEADEFFILMIPVDNNRVAMAGAKKEKDAEKLIQSYQGKSDSLYRNKNVAKTIEILPKRAHEVYLFDVVHFLNWLKAGFGGDLDEFAWKGYTPLGCATTYFERGMQIEVALPFDMLVALDQLESRESSSPKKPGGPKEDRKGNE